jgi:hypothetical protein
VILVNDCTQNNLITRKKESTVFVDKSGDNFASCLNFCCFIKTFRGCLKNRRFCKPLFLIDTINISGKLLKTLNFYPRFRNGCAASA